MNMKSSGLQALELTFLEEPEEPRLKKIKIDRSNLSLEEEPQVQLQRLHYADQKSFKKTQCFSEVLWNIHPKCWELQDGNFINLKTSIGPYIHFKLFRDTNLQSRLPGNIPFYEKCSLENRGNSIIGDGCSERNEHNILVTNPESWALHTKKREKSKERRRSWRELAVVNPIFNNFWAQNIITRTESLIRDVLEVQSNEIGTTCICEISRSWSQYQVLKPVKVVDSSNRKPLLRCLPARCFTKGRKLDVGFLFYKFLKGDGNISPFPKQTRCPANNNFRRKEKFQHLCKTYSRICERVIKPKLVKCDSFELLWQCKREYNCSTDTEKKETSTFSQRTVFNIHLKEISKGSSTKERHIFSKATVEGSNTFLEADNEKEKTARQHILSNNQMLQDRNIHGSTIWDTSLSNAKKMYYLTAHLRSLNTLSSVPNIFEKFNIKHSSLQMMVTMVTCTQKKKNKALKKPNVILEKFKTLHFVLRATQKRIARNSFNFAKGRKPVPRYLTHSNAVKKILSNCEDVQKTHCSSVVKAHLSLFETYEKVSLSDDEELYQISFLSKAIFNDENNEKYIKGSTASASKITYSAHDTLVYVLPNLLFSTVPKCNFLLMQECKSKNSHCPDNVSTNSQVLKHRINSILSPVNCSYSGNTLSLTSVIFYDPCIDQNTTVRVKTWHSNVALFGNRRKQNNYKCDKMKDVLQDQPVCKSRVSNSLKYLKKVENMKVLLQKGILLSGSHSSELIICAKRTMNDIKEIENAAVVAAYTRKRNKHQYSILPYPENELATSIGSKDRFTELSYAEKQEHFKDVTEKHLSLEFKNKYESEMKKQFDLVLEELNVFNDINKENENTLCEQRDIIQEDSLERSYLDSKLHHCKTICENKENVTFSTCGTTLSNTTVVNQEKNGQISFKDTGLKNCGEQEVPHEDCSSRILDEELFYPTSEEHFDSGCKQLLPWNPAFVSHSFMKERSYILQGERGNYFDDRVIRVQPLKTCHGPLRVGLSRKAKPKQLHPYLR